MLARPPRGCSAGAASARRWISWWRACATGPSRALVLRGEAGVGKSALLDYLLERASGCRVARAVGVESEMELAFAGLQQLCAPFAGPARPAPAPQRDALATAFGLRDGDAPDRFLVGLAVLSLLSDAADGAAAVVPGGRCAVARPAPRRRRSPSSPAGSGPSRSGCVFAVRDPPGEPQLGGLPELASAACATATRRRCWSRVLAGPLDERVRDRIVAETRGNPLALLELPRGLTPEELAGGFGLPDAPALSGRIEESFQRRLAELPRGDAAAAAGRRGRARRRPAAAVAGGRRAGDRRRRRGAGRRARSWSSSAPRCASATRSCGRRSTGRRRRRSGGASTGARRGHRSRRRSGSPRLAPRPGDGRARRGRRRRARALGRPGAGARRPGGGGGVPGARRRADARPGAAGRGVRSPRRRASTRPARPMRRCGCWRSPRQGRWTSSTVRGRSCCARRSRSL